jgi:hypothetical protein
MRAHAFVISFLIAVTPLANAQDAAYALTPAAAEKFVRATQQLVAGGTMPNVQGNANPANLANVKTALDGNPAAQQALAAAGLTSNEYVSFMGAAMTAMMVGQMEMAGVRGMLPPGVTTRPSQQNIDFMKSNVDLFERSMRPGAPTAAAAPGANAARGANTGDDEELPMPASAGDVLPSSILARLVPLDRITDSTDCTLGGAQATIEKEINETRALQNAFYGNPGNSGLARTPAEGAILERLEDSDLQACSVEVNGGIAYSPAFAAADGAWTEASNRIVQEQEAAWAACPGIPGGKEPECERRVNADAARKFSEAQRRFLVSLSQPFAARVEQLRACTVKRETIVKDAKAANVLGANVKLALRPLAVAWEQVMFLPAEWSGICETAQRYLQE